MNRITSAALAAAATAFGLATIASPNVADAAVSITVIPSLAPNAFGSPSWTTYVTNATTAIEAGQTSLGSGAAKYDALADGATLNYLDAIVTGFDSWRGVAAPGSAYSPEYGNRMHFGIHILGNGTKFSISQMSFVGDSTDTGNVLDWGNAAGVYNYSTDYIGIDYGPDNVKGGGNDTYITSGLNTQLVDELVGRGSGNSLDIYTTDPGATNQDKIYGAAAKFGITEDFSLSGTYTIGAVSGSASVNYAVPEPTGLALLGLGAGALLLRRRRSA
jgi:hypothetical protein